MPWIGRVEVLYNKQWGTVCDVGFNQKSANILCRSLGYGIAESFIGRSAYGRGIGKIWLQLKECEGNERSIHECDHNGWGGRHRCHNHAGDVGVKCRVPSSCTCNDDHENELVSVFSVS